MQIQVQERRLKRAWRSEHTITGVEDRKSPRTLDIIFRDETLERKTGIGLATTPIAAILLGSW